VANLLQSGSKYNVCASNGVTPLHFAAQYGHCKVCRILLEYGADPARRDSGGSTCLDLACEFGRLEVSMM